MLASMNWRNWKRNFREYKDRECLWAWIPETVNHLFYSLYLAFCQAVKGNRRRGRGSLTADDIVDGGLIYGGEFYKSLE